MYSIVTQANGFKCGSILYVMHIYCPYFYCNILYTGVQYNYTSHSLGFNCGSTSYVIQYTYIQYTNSCFSLITKRASQKAKKVVGPFVDMVTEPGA